MLDRRVFCGGLLALALGGMVPGGLRAQEVFTDSGLALRGYDAVAYFTHGVPQRGSEAFTTQWRGAEWRFVSEAHRDAFLEDPEAYAPQYGGYCAWAVSQGYTAPINPHAWAIVDGRLYLNASTRVQRRWARDPAGHIERADANWPELQE